MKVILLWLINEKGELLLSQRAAHRKTDASAWGPSVSGKVDSQEDLKSAVIRETYEELGLELKAELLTYLGEITYSNHADGREREFSMYSASVTSNIIPELRLNLDEVAEVKWIEVNELRKLQKAGAQEITNVHSHELWKNIFSNLEVINV
ncbi:MAG TPA: NUDIX domain-containing protein [Patescibacteria group bacterium]